ncbi:DUF3791 domain-containing protein [Clostridium fungisolvens]|uniref:DUF3791 domain-containing protein n=1 Tax=Clostridium fungisolvens TaxID=1604897 RepID=A0A6V8SQG4_9CLOT|nr:DUF3791 domain-containing protein [Clostridium fungisolvens]GFP77448.1 hypothetical protein bsdtw1_03576 [Clostridium fungisolvens]
MSELNREEQIIEFVSFCIENFKVKHNMKGKDVANLFKDSNAIHFLAENYDILHTQGKDYIIQEIEIFLRNRGYNF